MARTMQWILVVIGTHRALGGALRESDRRSVMSAQDSRVSTPGVTRSREARLLKALDEVPRKRFFPAGVDRSIPSDQPVPLGWGRTIPPVNVVATMLRALELEGTERVLEIGGASGYQAALLGRLARDVVSVEANDELVKRAMSVLGELGSTNVLLIHADAAAGWPAGAPYQAIVAGAAAPELPSALVDQLDVGGLLVIALGDSDAQLVERLRKRVDGLDSQTIGSCRLDMLEGLRPKSSSFPWTARHPG